MSLLRMMLGLRWACALIPRRNLLSRFARSEQIREALVWLFSATTALTRQVGQDVAGVAAVWPVFPSGDAFAPVAESELFPTMLVIALPIASPIA
jgi:ABC-type branched-subunit amino acid transport system substrate-binding protein